MRQRFFFAAMLVILTGELILALPTSAQSGPTDVTPANATGVMPYQSYWGAKENTNLGTGDLNVVVPVLSIPGRNGHDLVLNANYDSKIWQLQYYDDPYSGQRVFFWTWEGRPGAYNSAANTPYATSMGWHLFFPTLFWFDKSLTSLITCINYIVALPDGTKHAFPTVHINCWKNSNGQSTGSPSPVGDAGDGSFMRFRYVVDPTTGDKGIVSLKDGTSFYFPGVSPGATPSKMEDTDGNIVTYGSDASNHIVSMTDTVGRQITFTYSTDWFLTGVKYYDSNGVQRTITLNYTLTTLSPTFTNPPGASIINTPASYKLLTSIVLPNNLSWTFRYNGFGELIQITYPSGGYTKYDYAASTGKIGGQPADIRELVAKHVCRAAVGSGATSCTVAEDTTTYTPTAFSSGIINTQNVILDPFGNQTVVQFTNSSGGPFPYETSRTIYQGTSTVLRTIQTTYTNPPFNGQSWPPLPSSQTTILDDGQQSQIQWDYDTYTPPGSSTTVPIDNFVARREYSFGAGAPGALVRRTDYTWLKTNPINSQDYTSNAIHIMDRKASEKVYDGASNLLAQTTFEYDNFTTGLSSSGGIQHDSGFSTSYTTRGNLTATQRWRSTDGVWLTTRNQYDDAGNVTQTADPAGYITAFSYADSWGNSSCVPTGGNAAAYRTKITNALNQVTKYKYNSCSGKIASTTDPNNQTTSFTYDLMNRPVQTTFPDGGQTNLSYNESSLPLSATTTRKITSLLSLVSTLVVDGLGRTLQTQLTSDPDGTDFVDTTYDALGRKYCVSNPYRTAGDSTFGITTYQYDALNRVTQLQPPDYWASTPASSPTCQSVTPSTPPANPSNNVTTSYSGNTTTVSDQAGKKRKSATDALGRLTTVWEDPSGLSYETDYQYDALNNLTSVVQNGSRQRTFVYNSLSQLTISTNPESNTTPSGATVATTYSYNNDGNLSQKTMPAQNQPSTTTATLSYCYDVLNRLTSTAYTSQSCPMTAPVAAYFYDGNAPSGCSTGVSNYGLAIGRRTAMCDAAGSEAWTYNDIQNQGWQITDKRTTNGVTKSTVVQNTLDGSLNQLTYPSGNPATYQPGAAARPLSAVDSSVNYATAAHYAPQGALASLTNGANLYLTSIYNSRLQPCWLYATAGTALAWGSSTQCASSAATGNILDTKYNFNLGAGNNGDVIGITNNRDSTRSQAFTYDSLNRILVGETTSTYATSQVNCWGESYVYDNQSGGGGAWGNLTNINVAATAYNGCTQENLSVTMNPQNRISTTGYGYDTAGNVISAPSPGGGTYTYAYNAENQMTQAVTSSTTNYVYDGDGRRVEKVVGGTVTRIYWYGMGSDPLDETDGSGSTANGSFNEYVFLGGKRIARRDSSGHVFYYFADHLGTSRVIVQSGQTSPCYDADFYPFGGERIAKDSQGHPIDSCDSNYKFTGHERDSESTLDHFQFRNYGSTMGRWMSPDPINLTAKRLVDPANTLNKYVYGGNNPLLYVDLTGQDITAFYRAPSGLKDSGHILLAVVNQATGAVRFADYYPKNGSKDSFLPVPGGLHDVSSSRLKEHAALTIQTTPEVAQKVIDAIDAMSPPNGAPDYWLLTSSCANICADLLNLAGIDVPSTLVTPTDVWSILYAQYSEEALKGGQLHMGLYRYQPGRDFGSPMSVFPGGTDPFYNLQLLYQLADQQRRQQLPKGTVCWDDGRGNKGCGKQ